MNYQKRLSLSAKMLVCNYTVRELLSKIDELEKDTKTSTTEKISKMKIIQDEITKVSTEIDNIKKEITLLDAYRVN